MKQETETFEEWRDRTAPRGSAWSWRTALRSAAGFVPMALFFLVAGEVRIAGLLLALAALDVAQAMIANLLSIETRSAIRKIVGWSVLVSLAILTATDAIAPKDLLLVGVVTGALVIADFLIDLAARRKMRRA